MPVEGSKLSALTAVTDPGGTDETYLRRAGLSRKVVLSVLQAYIGAPIQDHLNEVDDHVHTAAKVLYDGTVPGAADVQAAVDAIHSMTADPGAFTAALDLLARRMTSAEDTQGGDLFAGSASILGVGTRAPWIDDFLTHQGGGTGVLTSGSIGEKSWLKGGAAGGTVTAIGSPAASRPGVVELSSGTAVGNMSMYAGMPFVPALSFFETHFHFRAMDTGTNVAYRAGMSDADFTVANGGEVPNNAIMIEKQAADTVWNISTVIAGTATRVATATAPAANVWLHVRMRRTSLTNVAIDYNVHTGGVPSPTWSPVTSVAFAPSNVFMRPYGSVRTNLVGTAYRAQFDRVSVLLAELNR